MTSIATGRAVGLAVVLVAVVAVGAVYLKRSVTKITNIEGPDRSQNVAETIAPATPGTTAQPIGGRGATKPPSVAVDPRRRAGTKIVGAWDSEPNGMFRHYYNIAERRGNLR